MLATANVNGVITRAEEAKISIMDRGFLYGDSVYEVVRTYSGVPLFYDEHFARLANSARLARLTITQTREFLHEEILRTVKASGNGKDDVYVRYAITRGVGNLDLDPQAARESSYVILVKPIPSWNPVFYSTGVRLAIPRTRRNSPQCLDPNIKSGNYLNNILAVAEAREMGADDALILSLDGKITESSNSNVGFIKDGAIIYPRHEPATHTGNLCGITKKMLELIAKKHGIAFHEEELRPDFVSQASECFITSATREVMPVCEVIFEGGKSMKFPKAGGTVTRRLADLYKQEVAEYIATHHTKALF